MATANDMTADLSQNPWTLYDKIMYGGLGYGSFTLPSNFFVIIITTLFPPLGQLINILGDSVMSIPPFFTLDSIILILEPENFIKLIYSCLLTTLFYIPGLVYVLTNIVESELIVNK